MIRTLRTYGYAAASEGVVALSNFGLLFLLGSRYPGELVAFYLLVRRVIAVVVPAINLGMLLGLVRNLVPLKHGGRLVALSLAVPFIGLALLSVPALLTPERFTTVAFGAQGYGKYAMPLLVAVAGIVLTTISIPLLRGRQRIAAAITKLIAALGAMPLLPAWLTPDIRSFLLTLGSVQGMPAARRGHRGCASNRSRRWRPLRAQHAPIQIQQRPLFRVPVVPAQHGGPAALPHRLCFGGVLQQPPDRLGDGLGVFGVHQQPAIRPGDDLSIARKIRCDHR